MDRVFIVMAEERGYCTNQWVIGVFSKKELAEGWRAKAQARADTVHQKIRALGEDEGIGASWRTVCITAEWESAHEDCKCATGEWFDVLQKLKCELFPEDPDAQVEWDCTMHYTVQEWSVDSREVVGHKRTRF